MLFSALWRLMILQAPSIDPLFHQFNRFKGQIFFLLQIIRFANFFQPEIIFQDRLMPKLLLLCDVVIFSRSLLPPERTVCFDRIYQKKEELNKEQKDRNQNENETRSLPFLQFFIQTVFCTVHLFSCSGFEIRTHGG